MLRAKRKIVVSVHGIRTTGAWQKEIASLISERGWIYFPLDYGYFPFYYFIFPFLRRQKIEWFRGELNKISIRFPGVTPSLVAHSNGTYIVAGALEKYPKLKLDKLIMCGSIVRRSFNWAQIFKRTQATQVRNEVGMKDLASRFVRLACWFDTGPSGQKGFLNKHSRLIQEHFHAYTHSSAFGFEHYQAYWIPFLEAPVCYEGESEPPWISEEPVSPQDASRWSAMTYFYQYVRRVVDAITSEEVYSKQDGKPVKATGLTILVPSTPGGASKNSIISYFKLHGMEEAKVGKTDSRSVFFKGEMLYDIPTTLNSLSFLDHRTDEELREAVPEFTKLIHVLITGAKSDCSNIVKIANLSPN